MTTRAVLRSRAQWLCLLGLLTWAAQTAAAPSEKDRRAARSHHDAGVKYYNIGRFEQAVAEFEKAYDLDPHPTLLFNLAKAHRNRGDLDRALFFYKRYLQMAPEASDRGEVQQTIRELEESVSQSRAPKPEVARESAAPVSSPPPATPPALRSGSAPAVAPDLSPAPPALPATSGSVEGRGETDARTADERFQVSLAAGVALPLVSGSSKVKGTTLFTGRVSGEYLFPLSRVTLGVGLSGTYSPIRYQRVDTKASVTSTLLGLFAGGSVALPANEKLVLSAGAGLGVVWWSGLEEGNPFAAGGRGVEGLLPLPSFRAHAAACWRVTPRTMLGLAPAFTFSKTTGDALTGEISSLNRLEMNLVLAIGL